MRDGTQKTGALSGVGPLILGVIVLVANLSHRTVVTTIIGVLLIAQGLVNVVIPRLVPSVPGWSAERVRARRTAVVAPLTSGISLVAAILLFAVVPANERNIGTTLLAAILLVAGVLGVLSGLGARRRAARLDSPEMSHSMDEIVE